MGSEDIGVILMPSATVPTLLGIGGDGGKGGCRTRGHHHKLGASRTQTHGALNISRLKSGQPVTFQAGVSDGLNLRLRTIEALEEQVKPRPFGKKFNYPERAVVLRPEPASASSGRKGPGRVPQARARGVSHR
jgi:hypothetical protein